MTNDADSLLDFPCRFPIKAMGRNESGFEVRVRDIVGRHAELWSEESVRLQASGQGNFLSVTITIEAVSRDQLDRIYQELTDCEQVLMAL